MDPKDISGDHISHMKSLGFKEDNLSDKLPDFYWTPKLHKTPYKHRSLHHLTAQQNLCLYSLPTSYLPSEGNCQTCHQSYSRTGINEMWILKNSSELLLKINSFCCPKITSIQTFDFPALYTSILHQKLRDNIHI